MQETRLHQSGLTKLLVVILQLVISHYAFSVRLDSAESVYVWHFFFFTRFRNKFYCYGYCSCTVHEQQPQYLICQTIFSHISGSCALFTGPTNLTFSNFLLKMDPTVLFTHLKIILLQCFSVFSFSFQLYPNGPLGHRIKAGTCKPFSLVIYFRRIRQRSDFFHLDDMLN